MTHSSLTHDLLITSELLLGWVFRDSSAVFSSSQVARELMSCDAVFPDAQDALLMSWSSSRGLQAEATSTHLARESR